ncbi:MAG: MMPL family transporter, partial [Acidimicrobiales bacterium]
AELRVLTAFTPVGIYAIDLTIALGLGLAVDYSLLLINRYREEIASGLASERAVGRALATAGRTIAFSALAVGMSLTALLAFPLYFLRSFAYAGIAVVAFALVGALLVMPALLGAFGTRVERRRPNRSGGVRSIESRFWQRVATAVTARPVRWALPVGVVLLVVGTPFLQVRFASPDDRVLPTAASAHQVGDILRSRFSTNASSTLLVVATGRADAAAVRGYSQRLSALRGVTTTTGPDGAYVAGRRVGGAAGPSHRSGGVSYWALVNRLPSTSRRAQALVRDVRAVAAPPGLVVRVGGAAADLVDQKSSIASSMPLAGAIIVVASFAVLFLFTGSLLIPVKALLLNALTLFSVLGIMVWVFQAGHLSGLLGFTPTATSTTMPPLLFVIAFGLSMDYEVFVISRIKEMHDQGATNRDAIVGGLASTGRIVSTAAALLSVTFFAFGLSKISFIQFFGLGTGIAILIDATVIRGLLVPAILSIVGEPIWWAPRPLRRLPRRGEGLS